MIAEQMKQVQSLDEIKNWNRIDSNELLIVIIQTRRYDLLEGRNIAFNLNNKESLNRLIEIILTDEDISLYLKKAGIMLKQPDANAIFEFVKSKGFNDITFSVFVELTWWTVEEIELLNNIVLQNKDFFRDYVNNTHTLYGGVIGRVEECLKLVIEENKFKLLDINNNGMYYSSSVFKCLANNINPDEKPPKDFRYLTESAFDCIVNQKDELTIDEFYNLLTLFQEKSGYDQRLYAQDNSETVVTTFVKNNFDYLIQMMKNKEQLPRCLKESFDFRDECIKRGLFDLAVQCVLPADVLSNENVVQGYCKALNVSPADFKARIEWLGKYYKRNNNVFNTILATSLKDGIFDFNKTHFERMINYVDVQDYLSRMSNSQLKVVSKILNQYSFKDYDMSFAISNIVDNIKSYNNLIESIDADKLDLKTIKQLVKVMQLPGNLYAINNVEDLKNYAEIKKQHFAENLEASSLDENKNNLFQLLFNINLEEAKYIYHQFCHNNEMMQNLQKSELPKKNFAQLVLVDKILHTDSKEELIEIYLNLRNLEIYKNELPLETYLKSIYTRLYASRTYNPEQQYKIGDKEKSVMKQEDYEGKKIDVYSPRGDFKILLHTVGTCTNPDEVISTNARHDWMARPQLRDNFLCCSYVTEKCVFSIRDGKTNAIMGFNDFEDGAMLLFAYGDIDSSHPEIYNSSRDIQSRAGAAKYYVPSELEKKSARIDTYSEMVLERRDYKTKNFAKRKPSYIICATDAGCGLNELRNTKLNFLTEEDIMQIRKVGPSNNELKNILLKYKETMIQHANESNITLKKFAYHCMDLIQDAWRYDACLKIASEFNVPMVHIDRGYYFQKALQNASYDEETKIMALDLYNKEEVVIKRKLFNAVVNNQDISNLLSTQNSLRY